MQRSGRQLMLIEQIEDWLGKPVIGSDGDKIGKLEDIIFAADSTPLLGAVSVGLLGRQTSLVPLAEASLAPDHVTIPYDKESVKNAPQLTTTSDMSGEIEDATADHYAAPRRQRAAEEHYESAEDRARRAEEARQAEVNAIALSQRADALAADVEQARTTALAAQHRLDELTAQHQEMAEQARKARDVQSTLEQAL